jgi:hypothetical protein
MQRLPEVVATDRHFGIAMKSRRRALDHRRRCVQPDSLYVRMARSHKRQQTSVSRAQIEQAVDLMRKRLEQQLFGGLAVGNRSAQVLADALGTSPLGPVHVATAPSPPPAMSVVRLAGDRSIRAAPASRSALLLPIRQVRIQNRFSSRRVARRVV